MSKINPWRLTVLFSIVLFIALSVVTGSWKLAVGYPKLVEQFQYRIVAEDYAGKNGTTVEEINQRFQENEQERYKDDKARGLPDCSFILTRGKPCARPPIVSGGPLMGFPKDTLAEIYEANKRALPSLMPLLSDLLRAVFAAAAICLLAPTLTRRVWQWLQGGRRNGI